jgi:hypothetical protein
MISELMRVSKVILYIEVPLDVNFIFWLDPVEKKKHKELQHLIEHTIDAYDWSPREVGLKSVKSVETRLLHGEVIHTLCSLGHLSPTIDVFNCLMHLRTRYFVIVLYCPKELLANRRCLWFSQVSHSWR